VTDTLTDMNTLYNLFRGFFKTRYVDLLEVDVARLRGENRALLNSLLGTAGFPPVDFAEPVKPVELPRLRKRSWQQVHRKNELDAMKG
jgi:hypothetical protein